ncbi:hypothetical protein ABPG72_014499 [Tetrahymena utriculariae]
MAAKANQKSKVNTTWMVPDTPAWIEVGKEEPETKKVFMKATIIDLNKDKTKVKLTKKEDNQAIPDEVNIEKVYQVNQSSETGFSDMVRMDNLNEAEIINNLELRYSRDIIYTYIGPTLIVMNPYKYIESAMSEQLLLMYQNELITKGFIDQRESPPHTYAVAGQAFSKLFENMKNQAIVISGESGAGKTENAKLAMKFLTTMSHHDSNTVIRISKGESSIEDKILSCNPILEAFGNAKTVRNDNSSRFGKYVSILVDKKSHKIQGASITNYLLEKSRVTVQGQNERNYHIFYHLLKGCSAADKKKLGLVDTTNGLPFDPEQFLYLKDGGCYGVSTIDDYALYNEVQDSFTSMNFSQHERNTIWRILSAILLLGNIRFDKSTLTDSKPCSIIGIEFSKKVAELLDMQYNILERCLLIKRRKVGNDITESPLNEQDIYANRDSLARTLYDNLFTWLVKRLNLTILPTELSEKQLQETCLQIGLLDIFGFEVFKINSFEQLCINYTNEKLQQLYISYVFKSEEQEFINEGLKDHIGQLSYNDNQEVIDLMDKYPKGIFDLLDESSSLGSSTDQQLFQKICTTHKSSQFFILNKSSADSFIIKHTAKNVEYCITNFRTKNKAEISQDIVDTVLSSTNELLGDIFLGLVGEEVKQKQFIINQPKKPSKNDKFLGAKFRFQMKQLMDELMNADCHFIRCIKPNEVKKKDYFLQGYAFIQIRYLGVLEAIYVRKEGFPYRKNFKDLYTQYGDMVKKFRGISLKKQIDQKSNFNQLTEDIITSLLPKVDKKKLLYGKTKIFTKDDVGRELDELLHVWFQKKNDFAKHIQHQFKVFKFKKNVLTNLKRISKIVKCFRRLAAMYKMKKQRKKFLCMKASMFRIKVIRVKLFKKMAFGIWKDLIIEQLRKERKKKSLALMMKLFDFHLKKKNFNNYKMKVQQKKKQIQDRLAKETEYKQKQLLEEQKLEKKKREQEEKQKTQLQQYQTQGMEMCISPDTTKEMTMNTENSNEYSNEKKSQDESSFQMDSPNQQLNMFFVDQIPNNDKMIHEHLKRGTLAHRMTNLINQKKIDQRNIQSSGAFDDDEEQDDKEISIIDNYLNPEQTPEELQGQVNIDKVYLSQDCMFNMQNLQESLKQRILENDYIQFCKDIYKKRSSWGRTIPFEKQGFHQKELLKKPLTNISPLLEPIAIKAFTRILKYAEVLKSKRDSRSQAYKLLELCFDQDSSLQDEIFLQIAKQLQTDDLSLKKKYYSLMAIYSSFISTSSNTIYPLLNCFYNLTLTEKDEINKQRCKFIFTRIRKCFQSPRVYLPTKQEIQMIENRKSIMVPIYIYINRCIFVAVESYTDISSAISFVLRELEIETNQRNYCLIEQITIENLDSQDENNKVTIEENILGDDEKIMDIYSCWENEKDLIKKKKLKQSFSAKIIFKIKNFFKFNKFDIDSIFMYYAHCCQDYLNGRFVLQDNVIVRLALLKLINDYNSIQESLKILKNVKLKIHEYIPINEKSESLVNNWQTTALSLCNKIPQCDSSQARTLFLNTLKKHSFLFMSHQFECHFYTSDSYQRNSLSSNSTVEEAIVAIKPFEILILEKQSKDIIDQFKLSEIVKFGKQSQNRITIILGDTKTFHFQLKDADPYIQIINQYIKMALIPV